MQKRRVESWPGHASLWGTLGLVLVTAWLSSRGTSGEAEPMLPEQVIQPEETLVEAPRTREPAAMHPKLDLSLNQLLGAYQSEGTAGAQTFAEAVEGLTEAVAGQGGQVQGHYEGLMEALVPVEALASLAELPEVQRICEPQRAVPE